MRPQFGLDHEICAGSGWSRSGWAAPRRARTVAT
jgi:hypothetical protein